MPVVDVLIWFVIAAVALFFFGLMAYGFFSWLTWFLKEWRYLSREIRRTAGKEQKYWKRRKRKLLCSVLPFVKYE